MDQGRTRKQPLEFRKEEVTYVMQRWRAAESCSLVGVGSVGKSNLLQHLADPDVQSLYMNTAPRDFKAIIIDPNLLGGLPQSDPDADQIRCWAGYELMMHRLFMAFYPFEVLGKDDAQGFYEAYQALQDGTNPLYAYMGLRYFELGLDYLIRRGIQIVFMFDEFEEVLRQLPVKFFQNLRGLRDANKRQISYLTFTRAPLPALVDQYGLPAPEMESFVELFTDNLYYVGPYNDADARRMVETLSARSQKLYPEAAIQFLLWATGAYAGLLRTAFKLLDTLGAIDTDPKANDPLLHQLILRRSVRTECLTMWASLTPSEQHVLKAVGGLEPYHTNAETDRAVAALVQKRLLRVDKNQQTLHIEPPLFRTFVGLGEMQDL